MTDLVFVKQMHQGDLMAAVATPSAFFRCSSEIFDKILLFLCFIFDNVYSQMYSQKLMT